MLSFFRLFSKFCCVLLVFLSLISYTAKDPSFFHSSNINLPISNIVGLFGANLSDLVFNFWGLVGFVIFFFYSIRWMFFMENITPWRNEVRLLLLISISLTPLTALYLPSNLMYCPQGPGGILGTWLGWHMVYILGHFGTIVFCIFIIINFFMHLNIFEIKTEEKIKDNEIINKKHNEIKKNEDTQSFKKFTKKRDLLDLLISPEENVKTNNDNIENKKEEKKNSVLKVSSTPEVNFQGYQIPLNLLQKPKETVVRDLTSVQKEKLKEIVEQKLADFSINATVVNIIQGPIVTRLELALEAGTKASRLTSIGKDLARSMSVSSVRVVEVIPGKSYVGLEIPNEFRQTVFFYDMIASNIYKNASSPLTLVLGKDISGDAITADLMKMPHLLVAGTTGSGKSVGVNTMLLSMLYKSSPEDLKLILIDPKMLELAIYGEIPHLLTPVVTDMNDAAAALRWSVAEMEQRYQIMAALGVRNIQGYNEKVNELINTGRSWKDAVIREEYKELFEGLELKTMPYIVIVADEFADMMMVVGKKVEQLIARLAQKARASGIHLILATQRPSVDVITGLIKANIPTRIAFQVSSKIDSRTILDQMGAETLLGSGDMLYMPPGSGLPIRVHGAFVRDEEVYNVVEYLKKIGKPSYLNFEEKLSDPVAVSSEGQSVKDALFEEAVEFIMQAKRISVSSLQRRFRIGYNRAATLVEAMEERGIISSPDDMGQRRVIQDSD